MSPRAVGGGGGTSRSPKQWVCSVFGVLVLCRLQWSGGGQERPPFGQWPPQGGASQLVCLSGPRRAEDDVHLHRRTAQPRLQPRESDRRRLGPGRRFRPRVCEAIWLPLLLLASMDVRAVARAAEATNEPLPGLSACRRFGHASFVSAFLGIARRSLNARLIGED